MLSAVKGGKVYPTAEGEQRPKPGRPRSIPSAPRTGGAGPAGLDEMRVIDDLRRVKKLKGGVYLVDVGDTVDIAITDKLDKQTILNAPTMQAYKGRIQFINIEKGEGREGWVVIKEA